jgi:subtilase family serine protease
MYGWMYTFATEIFNTKTPPVYGGVTSISYGWPETDQCDKGVLESSCSAFGGSSVIYMNRTNTEFQKLGAGGHTLVSSSGDTGAPGDFNDDCTNKTYPLGPLYPASSPYITSAGATAILGSGNGIFEDEDLFFLPPTDATAHKATPNRRNVPHAPAPPPICTQFECSTVQSEVPCILANAIFTSGGGFSAYFPQPSYQSTAVTTYLNSGVALPPAQYWNRSNRGLPDVGAIGQNVIVIDGGSPVVTGGTSASAPTTAGILTLINNHLVNNGKPPLGFANPMLYQMAAECTDCFHDVDMYNNKCTELACCQYGYVASDGWDPVTGLGSLSFSNILTYLDSSM